MTQVLSRFVRYDKHLTKIWLQIPSFLVFAVGPVFFTDARMVTRFCWKMFYYCTMFCTEHFFTEQFEKKYWANILLNHFTAFFCGWIKKCFSEWRILLNMIFYLLNSFTDCCKGLRPVHEGHHLKLTFHSFRHFYHPASDILWIV